MKCPAYERHLLAALEQLPAAEARALERHGASCLPCRQLRREAQQLIGDVSAAPPMLSSEHELAQRIMRACRAHDREAKSTLQIVSNQRSWLQCARQPLLATAAAAAAAVFWLSGPMWSAGPFEAMRRTSSKGASATASLVSSPPVAEGASATERRLHRAELREAETHYLQLLEVQEGDHGVDSAEVVRTLDTLTTLYAALGQYVEAERCCQRSLAIKRRIGMDHTAIASQTDALRVLLALTTEA